MVRAAAAGHVVRVAGASHSFTDAVVTDGALLSLRHRNRVLDIDRAKQHFQAADTLCHRCPGWESFADVRRRLDPERRFANSYIHRVLGET
ncbi:D-arabinono-1,4-lactone oxidase [Streptomyces sp. NPDC057592]|uniref:D-arabinono-1,4-lactone oxidase n=1 Tax=unclassified Streptomyces TaxID=2593676 RepID=UPI0036907B50